jgi:hypothetical protein
MITIEKLWGAIVQSVTLDLAERKVALEATIEWDQLKSTAVLVCEGVSEFHYDCDAVESWDYVELTAIEVMRLADGRTRLDATLWTEASGLSILCDQVTLNGVVV